MTVDPNKKIKTPWSTRAAMEQIYEMNLWGGNPTDYYSGDGSHHTEFVGPYIEVVKSFLNSFKSPLIVCDLGCGDFNVGKELVPFTKKYIAVDNVEKLIERNKEIFTDPKIEFHCLDIAKDRLPSGDCVVIRQVLQHISNSEIQQIIEKLVNFKYVVVTEHLPEGEFIPNKDILSGQGIRRKESSGVNLLAPPFNFYVKQEKQLLAVALKKGKGRIVTTLYTLF